LLFSFFVYLLQDKKNVKIIPSPFMLIKMQDLPPTGAASSIKNCRKL